MPDSQLRIIISASTAEAQARLEAFAAQLQASGASAEEAAAAIRQLGAAADVVTTSVSGATAAVAENAVATDAAAYSNRGLGGALAYGTVRAAAYEARLGPMGYVLGRIGSSSKTLGPILQALFPVAIAGLFADMLLQVADKMVKVQSASAEAEITLASMPGTIAALDNGLEGTGKVADAATQSVDKLTSALSKMQKASQGSFLATLTVGGSAVQSTSKAVESLRLEVAGTMSAWQHGAINAKTAIEELRADQEAAQKAALASVTGRSAGAGSFTARQGGGFGPAPMIHPVEQMSAEQQAAIGAMDTGISQVVRTAEDGIKKADEAAKKAAEKAKKAHEAKLRHEKAVLDAMLRKKEEHPIIDQAGLAEEARNDAMLEQMTATLVQQEAELRRIGAHWAPIAKQTKATADNLKLAEESIKKINAVVAPNLSAQQTLGPMLAAGTPGQGAMGPGGLFGPGGADATKQPQMTAGVAVGGFFSAALGGGSATKQLNVITHSFNKALDGWIQGTETFGQAFSRMWASLAVTVIENLAKMGIEMVAHTALTLIMHKLTQKAAASSGAAAAGASAAHVPMVGWMLAPMEMATFFAQAMSFAQGGLVPATGIAQLHAREMVLPAHLSDFVQQSAAQASGQGRGPSNVRVNFAPQVNATDATGVRDVLKNHSKVFMTHFSRELRKANIL